jgi:chromosome partitioning protein
VACTITFLNQKGGVGKTSSCFHLSAALAKLGWRVLLIDNDPQASLTQGFFGPDATRALPPDQTIAAVYEPTAAPLPEALIRPTGLAGVALIAGSESATTFNKLPDAAWPERQGGLRSLLADLADDYDLVLIDCPPNLHLCSWAALVASHWIVIPVQAEDFGSQGLGPVLRAIQAVQRGDNPRLAVAGFLLTMFDRRLAVHLTYEAMLRQLYGDRVFTAAIPRAKDFVEAVAARTPVGAYKPRTAAAKAMGDVASELLIRVGLGTEARSEKGVA